MIHRAILLAALAAFLATASPLPADAMPVQAKFIDINPPGDRDFVLDCEGMITAADMARIRQTCQRLQADKATPIIIVTINSMAVHGPKDLGIEAFTQLLFDEWGIGQATLHGRPWNTGILLLVSQQDRKARIQLGAGWARDKDAACLKIMDGQIVPRFKAGNFSGGILAGVEELDKMVRGEPLAAPLDTGDYGPSAAGSSSGWSGAFASWCGKPMSFLMVIVLGLVMFIVQTVLRALGLGHGIGGRYSSLFYPGGYGGWLSGGSGGGFSSGGFGGGSFGGGFSGGGGASGSW